MKRLAAASAALLALASGCRAPDDRLPTPNPNQDRIVTFHFDLYDEAFNGVERAAQFIVTPLNANNAPGTITSEGVTTVGTHFFTSSVPIVMPVVLDEATVEVTIQVTVLAAEPGDEMHCWVERGAEYLISSERLFAASLAGPLFGMCSYTVGMPS